MNAMLWRFWAVWGMTERKPMMVISTLNPRLCLCKLACEKIKSIWLWTNQTEVNQIQAYWASHHCSFGATANLTQMVSSRTDEFALYIYLNFMRQFHLISEQYYTLTLIRDRKRNKKLQPVNSSEMASSELLLSHIMIYFASVVSWVRVHSHWSFVMQIKKITLNIYM